jgi:hypothetical protein
LLFFFGCLTATWIGRKIGWALSRNLLYTSTWAVCIVLCLAWATGVAYALRLSILAMHPGLLLKLFSYGAGAYISIPNYGLLNESTVPEYGRPRHDFIKGVPSIVYIVASVVFAFTVSTSSSDARADRLTPNEFSVLSSALSKKEPLGEGDLNSLREMVRSYTSRTGHHIPRQDVAVVTKAFATSNRYYYELARSMLLSWDGGNYQTTKEFDSLYIQMEQDGGRKPSKLQNDKNRITLAAEHRPVEEDEGGIQYELSRDSIVQQLQQIKIWMDNARHVISVLNELAQ